MKIAVGFDIETTGLSQVDGHRIVEFAALMYDLDTGKYLAKLVERVNPERPIDPKAQAVHGISFEELVSCPTWEFVAPKLVRVLEKADVIVAHNGIGFDMPFLNGELFRIGLPMINTHCVDTMTESRWSTCYGKYPNLGELCFATGTLYEPEKAHSASYDVEVMMECFFKARKKGFFKLEELSYEVL